MAALYLAFLRTRLDNMSPQNPMRIQATGNETAQAAKHYSASAPRLRKAGVTLYTR